MQHKFLLRFIKQEMQKQKIVFKNNESFFKLFLKDEPWENYRSNMSNWLNSSSKDGVIHKHIFIFSINEKLELDPSIWGASDDKQKIEVVKGVTKFKASLANSELLSLLVENVELSDIQKDLLHFVKDAKLSDIIKKMKTMPTSFIKNSDNQKFLICFLEEMYKKGAYDFIYTNIFPCLLDSYDNSIRSKKAHIYASLTTPMYREAFDILSAIKGENRAETMDLQTSAISNIRRERLSSQMLSKESLKGLLEILIASYTKIYVPKEPYAYYPAINLAYMLGLAKHIFPYSFEEMSQGYTLGQLYDDVKYTIKKAKSSEEKEEIYYASMSEIEFQLLLNRHGMVQELEYLVETLMPSPHLIHQTQRQMGLFFVKIIKQFSTHRPLQFEKAVEVLDAYVSMKSR